MKRIISIWISLVLLFSFPMVARAASVPKVKGLTVVGTTSSSVRLTWKKVSKASGYKVYYSTQKTKGYRHVMTLKKATTTAAKINKLKSNKTYYFKVRAFKGKTKGKFSEAVSAKTKKWGSITGVKKSYYYRPDANNNGGYISELLSFNAIDSAEGFVTRYYYSDSDYSDVFVKNSMKKPQYICSSSYTIRIRIRAFKTVSGKRMYGPWKTVFESDDFDLEMNKNIKTVSETEWEAVSSGYQLFEVLE